MKQTKRVGIQHLKKMRPLDFLKLMTYAKDELGGILNSEKVRITEKVDGSAFRFGVDGRGELFIETSHSGPKFEVGDFNKSAIEKFGKDVDVSISTRFDNLLSMFKNDSRLKSTLDKMASKTKNGVKVIGEIFDMSSAQVVGNTVKFVGISYDRAAIAKYYTMIVFDIVDGNGESIKDKDVAISTLSNINNKDRAFHPIPSSKIDDVDLTFAIDKVSSLVDEYTEIEQLLNSRLHKDREAKKYVIDIISQLQVEVTDSIVQAMRSSAFGPDIEGIVIETPDITFKVISDKFLEGKKTNPNFINESFENFFQYALILEGGNAVSNVVRINRANIDQTLKSIYNTLLPIIGLSTGDVVTLGSVGKKDTSGDLDLGYNAKVAALNLKSKPDEVHKVIQSKLEDEGYEVAKLAGGITSIGWPISNVDGEQTGEYVQLDLMPSQDLETTQWALYGTGPDESKYKGAIRNMLLALVARAVDWEILEEAEDESGENIPVKWKRLVYNAGNIVQKVQSRTGKNNTILKNPKDLEKVDYATGHQAAIDIMFGPGKYTKDELLTTEDVLAAITKSDFPYKHNISDIMAGFKRDLEASGEEFPSEYEQYL